MKNLFFGSVALLALAAAGPAVAADMPARAPVYKAAPAAVMIHNWTGFYIGGHAGWAWIDETSVLVSDPFAAFPPGFTGDTSRDGLIAGGQIGFDWQSGNWVFGIEGDWSWTDSNVSVPSISIAVPGLVATATGQDNWYATLTGRIGYAQDIWLVYVKGGVAWWNVDDGGFTTGIPGVGTATLATITSTRTGWTVGAGIEWALWTNWSAKIEYNYMDFGTDRYTFTTATPIVAPGGTVDIDTQVHAVKLGLNYRFGGFGKGPVGKGPVVTRY
jgi:outer membrane immunogenic protein